MRERTARVAGTFAVVALLVGASLTGAVGGAAATTSSSSTTVDCDRVDKALWYITVETVNDKQCDPVRISDRYQEMNQTETNQTKLDLYQTTVSISETDDLSSVRNSISHADAMAWAKAQQAVVAAYKNGTSLTVAQSEARVAIQDYYAKMQKNILAKWEGTLTQWHYTRKRAHSEGYTDVYRYQSVAGQNIGEFNSPGVFNATHDVTLTNGETYTTSAIKYYAGGNAQFITPAGHYNSYNGETTLQDEYYKLFYRTPSDDYSTQWVRIEKMNETTDGHDWFDVWAAIESKNTQLQDNVNKFAESVYNAADNGSLNVSDVVNPYTMISQYNTERNKTGYWSYSVSSLAAAGLETPNLNGTSVMTVKLNSGRETQGLIMSHTAPNGSWETGVTYDPANIEGAQILVETTGNNTELTEPFTLTKMTNQQGETIKRVNTTEYVTKTYNATELQEMVNKTLALQRQTEAREPTGGGGGFELGGGGMGIAALAAAGVAIALIASD
jgi:hypothetical protein